MNAALDICEIFHSIQGESTWAGSPCSFIRLHGCNLDCSWCDTKYSREEAPRRVPVPLIVEAIRPHGTTLAEITGGEPLLQPATPALASALLGEGYTVHVETNGSLDISVLPYPAIRIMDLKTPSSGMAARNRLENFVHLRAGDEIKMVIADRMDYEWAVTMMKEGGYPSKRVATLLSPARGRVESAELAEWMLADKLPARMNLQLHKYIWPEIDRGV
jgi:7-carboxy-7-deazaguanine synthase